MALRPCLVRLPNRLRNLLPRRRHRKCNHLPHPSPSLSRPKCQNHNLLPRRHRHHCPLPHRFLSRWLRLLFLLVHRLRLLLRNRNQRLRCNRFSPCSLLVLRRRLLCHLHRLPLHRRRLLLQHRRRLPNHLLPLHLERRPAHLRLPELRYKIHLQSHNKHQERPDNPRLSRSCPKMSPPHPVVRRPLAGAHQALQEASRLPLPATDRLHLQHRLLKHRPLKRPKIKQTDFSI